MFLSLQAFDAELWQAVTTQTRKVHPLLAFGAVVNNLHCSVAVVLVDGIYASPTEILVVEVYEVTNGQHCSFLRHYLKLRRHVFESAVSLRVELDALLVGLRIIGRQWLSDVGPAEHGHSARE